MIDPLAEGKNQGPRFAIEFLKSIIPSTLPSVEMGEDRQEYSRIVTDMAGQQIDPAVMQTFSGPATVGMEQVVFQSGDLLGVGRDQEFQQFRDNFTDVSCEQEVIDVLNQWPPAETDFSVGFEPFDLEMLGPF